MEQRISKVWEVSGFVFEKMKIRQNWQKEVEGIQYIHDNMNMDNPQMVQEITRESWLRNCSIHR